MLTSLEQEIGETCFLSDFFSYSHIFGTVSANVLVTSDKAVSWHLIRLKSSGEILNGGYTKTLDRCLVRNDISYSDCMGFGKPKLNNKKSFWKI